MFKRNIKISGIGTYVPNRTVYSSEIDSLIGAKSGWSERKSGVKKRYFVTDETASFMGAEAAKRAIEDASIKLEEVDCIVSGSGTMEQAIPCNAALIQKQLGLQHSGVPSFDVNSTCLSFLTALDMISYAIESGRFQNVLIVSSEIASVGLNWKQDESSILFGDGAVAVVVSKSNGQSKIISSHMETYSVGAHLSEIRGGGTKLHPREYSEQKKEDFLFDMDGKAIFKLSYKIMPTFINKLFKDTNLAMDDIKMVIPHQASASAMRIIRKKLGVNEDSFMTIIENYGNMIAASIPMALFESIKQGKVQRGDKVLFLGTSAGLSIGGIILEY
ncbi:beta-ketoacyl-ACP synthase III [Metabacillus malikii]|uniref:3-oxoacyl-[acyl-carrier-protein] synthase-3 n=1 Tax=Metabacillus malikii TaxID=1504265 RepID=A0ABT9ZKR8_9BACI|nr:beta-ketoacyl-ACP synthase III [Metabacillus malikii]MDQ0232575.1 3-oxoacyl-[acyl-carrier-protein] synthase-3 [Metabacillus malikii]